MGTIASLHRCLGYVLRFLAPIATSRVSSRAVGFHTETQGRPPVWLRRRPCLWYAHWGAYRQLGELPHRLGGVSCNISAPPGFLVHVC
jgi:hypothetical protein